MAPRNKKRAAEESSNRDNETRKTRRRHEEIPSFGSSILKVHVGEGPFLQTFFFHKDIATKFSDFLATACRNGWKEATEGVVNLPEEGVDSFAMFEAFVYYGRIYSRKEGDEYTDRDHGSCDWEYSRLAAAWLLGERLQASAFKDAIVDALMDKVRSEYKVPLALHEDVYAKSAGRSPMKELLVDIAIWGWRGEELANNAERTGEKAFFTDLAIKQSSLLRKGGLPQAPYLQGSTCIYHEHYLFGPCYTTMFK